MHEDARRAMSLKEVDNDIEDLGAQDGRGLKILSGGSGASQNEYARANNGADSESREANPAERLFETPFRMLRVFYQLIDTLAAEEL